MCWTNLALSHWVRISLYCLGKHYSTKKQKFLVGKALLELFMELEEDFATMTNFQNFGEFQGGQWPRIFSFGSVTSPPKGPLLYAYPTSLLFESEIPIITKLSRVICDCSWAWPSPRSNSMLKIQASLVHIHPSNHFDLVIWTPSKFGIFHLGSTWNFLRVPYLKIHWYSLVWLKGMIPKNAFICWLALLERLSTHVGNINILRVYLLAMCFVA